MKAKKTIILFSLFFGTLFFVHYICARIENRNDYHFVITNIDKSITGHFTVKNSETKFKFLNFDSFGQDIRKEDSLVKKALSKNVYIYRKDKKTNKYFLVLVLNESAIFPIEWQ